MDHPCYKCGQSVEEGRPFCSHCGAPQIRVAISDAPLASPTANLSSDGTPASFDSPAPGSLSPRALSTGVDWSRGLRVCAVASLIAIVVMFLRLMIPPLATLGAGCLAVILYYRQNSTLQPANARSGAQIGAVTGLLCAAVFAVFVAILLAMLQAGGQFREQMLQALQQFAAHSSDPQMQATLDFLKKPEGLASRLILGMVGFLLVSVVAGGLAGAMTGLFIGRRRRP